MLRRGRCREESDIRYLALLRGVNVGGKNKLSMSELKVALKTASLRRDQPINYQWRQYLVFQCRNRCVDTEKQCEMMIKGGFGMDIPVAVISAAALFDDSFSALDFKTDARFSIIFRSIFWQVYRKS